MSPSPHAIFLALASQCKSGAFPSTVWLAEGPVSDENAFATAHIVNQLARCDTDRAVSRSISRALDFLESCECRKRPGHFVFYPRDRHPDWLTVCLPPDTDDTALISALLVRYGRRPQAYLRYISEHVLSHHRLLYLAERSDPWLRIGAYETWLDQKFYRNPVDCCVNINALSMLQQAGSANENETSAITAMIEAAFNWAGMSKAKARMLSPWYPDPIELVFALDRAVDAGAHHLLPLATRAWELDWVVRTSISSEKTAICGSSDGRIIWTCHTLQKLRL